jgi:hypothetical protein
MESKALVLAPAPAVAAAPGGAGHVPKSKKRKKETFRYPGKGGDRSCPDKKSSPVWHVSFLDKAKEFHYCALCEKMQQQRFQPWIGTIWCHVADGVCCRAPARW